MRLFVWNSDQQQNEQTVSIKRLETATTKQQVTKPKSRTTLPVRKNKKNYYFKYEKWAATLARFIK